MNEQHLQAYTELIQNLLKCASGEELNNILQQHSDLVDITLAKLMGEYAKQHREQEDLEIADFLENLARQLTEYLQEDRDSSDSEAICEFLTELLQAVCENPTPEFIYPILESKKQYLNPTLAELLQSWAEADLSQLLNTQPEEAEFKAGVILNFSKLIQEFTLGNLRHNLEISIIGYKATLIVFSSDRLPEFRSHILYMLGNAYSSLAEMGVESKTNLQEAIKYYKEDVLISTKLKLDQNLVVSLNCLGNTYNSLAEMDLDSEKNLRKAIKCYNKSRKILISLNLEHDLPDTLYHLGLVYWSLSRISVDPEKNLREAIKLLKQSDEISTRLNLLNLPLITGSLGLVYSSLSEIGVDSKKNLREAIKSYKQAENNLEESIKSCEAVNLSLMSALEETLSIILTNLGSAYSSLSQKNIEQENNLQTSLNYHKIALEIRKKLNSPEEDSSYILHNLGHTYVLLAQIDVDSESNLLEAIKWYGQAADIRKRLNLETRLSLTLNGLGEAYMLLAQIDVDSESNLLEAIKWYDQAADIRKRLNLDKDHSTTLDRLGSAYEILALIGVEKEKNRQQAVSYYRQALEFFKTNLLPVLCRSTGRNLGNLAFRQEWWEIALEGYQPAITAIEQIRTWSTTDEERQEILQDAINIYSNAIQCYINLGNLEAAIILADRSRSRYLVDLIATNDLYPDGDIPQEVLEYEAKQREIDQLHRTQQRDRPDFPTRLSSSFDLNQHYEARMTQLLQEKAVLWQKLRRLDPVLASQKEVTPLQFADLQALVDSPTTALLSFYSTPQATYIFILRQNGLTLHTCPRQEEHLQQRILYQWLQPYTQDTENWCKQIPENLQELSQHLQLAKLIEEHLEDIEELILIPHIFLHLIPFAALSINPQIPNSQFLGDRFRLRYAFSGQILHFCQQRETIFSAQYGTVEGASNDVPLAAWLGKELTRMFNIPSTQRLKGIEATKENYLQLVKSVNSVTNYHHAGSNLGNPLESALELADGKITLGELMFWRILQLVEVFLACCETNLGLPNLADDIITLASGFLTAGARTVISTLWSVDQLATAIFCFYYYKHRQGHQDCSTAIKSAQKDLRELSAARLESEFKPLIQEYEKYLDLRFQQLKILEKEARQEGDMRKAAYYNKEARDIRGISAMRKELNPKSRPFSSPYYWGGFICQGLR
jgi:CHAT domain-containing protein/tetratricopeptide (TPR) repeat protein